MSDRDKKRLKSCGLRRRGRKSNGYSATARQTLHNSAQQLLATTSQSRLREDGQQRLRESGQSRSRVPTEERARLFRLTNHLSFLWVLKHPDQSLRSILARSKLHALEYSPTPLSSQTNIHLIRSSHCNGSQVSQCNLNRQEDYSLKRLSIQQGTL